MTYDVQKIIKGEIYKNLSFKYLSKLIRFIFKGQDYLKMANMLSINGTNTIGSSIVAFGVDDLKYREVIKNAPEYLLFMLVNRNGFYHKKDNRYIDSKRANKMFYKFLNTYKHLLYDNYPFNLGYRGLESDVHCLVFDISPFENIVDNLKANNISNLCTPDQLNILTGIASFKKDCLPAILKHKKALEDYRKNMKDIVGVDIHTEPKEYEIPFISKREIFNYG